MKVNISNRDENPDLTNAILDAASNCAGRSIETILDETGAHPITCITALIDCLSAMLRHMDRKAANVILKDIAFERTNIAAQKAASQTLLAAYEAACDLMEHEEAGGRLS